MKKLRHMLPLCLVLVLSMASCGTPGAPESSQSPASTPPPSTADGANTAVPATSGEETDGASIFPLANPVVFTFGLKQNNNVTDYDNNYFTKYLKELTNIDLEFVLFPSLESDAQTKLDMMMVSGEKLPDIITFGVNAKNALNYGTAGKILPLNGYFEKYGAGFYEWSESLGLDGKKILADITSSDGNLYATPFYSYSYNNENQLRANINMQWLETLGLEVPKTSDDLVEVLRAFRDGDPNGNGVADEIPLIGCQSVFGGSVLDYIANMFIYSDKGNDLNSDTGKLYLPLSESGGVLDVAYDKEAYRQFLIYANMLVKEGLMSPLSFTVDESQFIAMQQADPEQIGLIVSGSPEATLIKNYRPFEALTGPEGKRYVTTFAPNGLHRSAITSSCEKPDLAFQFLMLGTEPELATELQLTMRYGELGVNWEFAPEGTRGQVPGKDAMLTQLEAAWGVPTDKLWQYQPFVYVSNPEWWVTAYNEQQVAWLHGLNYGLNNKHGIPFSDVPGTLNYTAEELEQWNDTMIALNTYVKESRTLFVLGEMDPNNDAAWNSYLSELAKLKYKDILAVDNTALARKNASMQ